MRTALSELPTVVALISDAFKGVRKWDEISLVDLASQPAYHRLIEAVPGLATCFGICSGAAPYLSRPERFANVVKHTLRLLICYQEQVGVKDPATARQDPRGVFNMAREPFGDGDIQKALEMLADVKEEIDTLLPGFMPLVIIWHDGWGLKEIAGRGGPHS